MIERDGFEEHLRRALRRMEPPAGLEQRIFARLPRSTAPRIPRWWPVAAAIFVILGGALLGDYWRQHQMRARRVETERQFSVALKVTERTLAKAERQLRSIGVERIVWKEVGP